MLTEEQLQDVKLHLLKQLENFPEDQRKIVKHKILSMNKEEMDAFLKENKLDYSKEVDKPEKQQCIFCAIANGKIKSYKIAEDEDYIAILELNPLSKGHVLILPKKHTSVGELGDSALEFAKKIAGVLFDKLSPKDIQFQKNEVLGHGALEAVPIYGEEKLEKKRASDEELQNLQKELSTIKEEKKVDVKPVEEKKEPIKAEVKEDKTADKPMEKKPELPKMKPRVGWL